MTDVPAPAPQLPAQFRAPSRTRQLLDNNMIPLVVALIALVLGVYALVGSAQNTETIAKTSAQVSQQANERAAITADLNAKLAAAFCDYTLTIANVPIAPQAEVGKIWVLQARTTVEVLGCVVPKYLLPDAQLCAGLQTPVARCQKTAP